MSKNINHRHHSEAWNVPVMDLMNETTTIKLSEQNLVSIPYSSCKMSFVATYYSDKLPPLHLNYSKCFCAKPIFFLMCFKNFVERKN